MARLGPFELEVRRLAKGGAGEGTAPDGRPMRVRGAPPGSRVKVRPAGKRKGIWTGRRQYLVRPPADHERPPCPQFGLCGGCTLQVMTLQAQRDAKHEWALREAGPGIEGAVRHELRGLAAGYGYRNKVELSFGSSRYLSEADHAAGLPIDGAFLGFHAPGRFDRVVDTERCWLVGDVAEAVVACVRAHALAPGAPPCWNPRAHSGFWRHLVLRDAEGGMLVALYTTSTADPGDLPEALLAIDGVVGVIWGVNDGVADVARGEVKRVWGSATTRERLFDKWFRLSVTSFFQTNTRGAEVLYDTVREALRGRHPTLLDLYCGIGTIGICLADRFEQVIGIEEVEAAVADARDNAAANGVDATYRAARVEDALDVFDTADVSVVVDPPRAGLHPKVARRLAKLDVPELIYVACSPRALGRDGPVLIEGGWRCTDVWAVDLFPQTGHLELVARYAR